MVKTIGRHQIEQIYAIGVVEDQDSEVDPDLGGLHYKDTQLTAAQILALLATNIEVVPAPPTGYAVIPVGIHLFLDHGGTDFVQPAATDHLALKYSASNEIAEIGTEAQCTAFLEATGDKALYDPLDATGYVPESATAIDLDNNGASEYTTGDGTISVRVFYKVVPMKAFG